MKYLINKDLLGGGGGGVFKNYITQTFLNINIL